MVLPPDLSTQEEAGEVMATFVYTMRVLNSPDHWDRAWIDQNEADSDSEEDTLISRTTSAGMRRRRSKWSWNSRWSWRGRRVWTTLLLQGLSWPWWHKMVTRFVYNFTDLSKVSIFTAQLTKISILTHYHNIVI